MIPAHAFGRFKREPLVVATAYDFPFAQVMEAAGVDVILVGDSLANVVLGLATTRDIGMDEICLFLSAVRRGAPQTHIMADMPFGADADPAMAVSNGKRFMGLGAHSVKIEGPKPEIVAAMTEAGIPVVGHLGLLPQTALTFKQVGREAAERDALIRSAMALSEAGAIAMVLEHMDFDLAAEVTRRVTPPTIGIGAGPGTDGQVLVLHDMLGLSARRPPFAKAFAGLREAAIEGAKAYAQSVRERSFP